MILNHPKGQCVFIHKASVRQTHKKFRYRSKQNAIYKWTVLRIENVAELQYLAM